MGENENLSLRLQVRPDTVGRPRIRSRRRILCQGASRKLLRLDCLPPSSSGLPGQGMNASRKLELPPTKKDDLKAPGKKSGTAVKKEKPKHISPKIKGAELWRDCPAEFLRAAKAGLVSGRLSIQSPGPGLLLKEIIQEPHIAESETAAISEKIDLSPSSASLDKLRDKSLGTSKKFSNTPKQNRTFPKPKGKSK